jgi:hypothetical protein
MSALASPRRNLVEGHFIIFLSFSPPKIFKVKSNKNSVKSKTKAF